MRDADSPGASEPGTSETRRPRRILRRIGAVLAGLLVIVILSLRHRRGAARDRRLPAVQPMQHALALGVVGLAISFAGAAATWNAGPAFGSKWYPLAVIAIALPSAWVGGRLRERQLRAN